MKAAVVHSYDAPPRYLDAAEPTPGEDECIVEVRAAALSQLVRAQASGRHYVRPPLPFVPGVDGVGVSEGRRVYFAFPKPPHGAMAERVAVPRAYVVPLPDDLSDVHAAASANPVMSSWAALTQRTGGARGKRVWIQGAAGASGRLAIGVAKHLGASRVVASARRADVEPELRALGADEFVLIEEERSAQRETFARAARDGVDIVLDYVWGPSALSLLEVLASHGIGDRHPIRFINIGSVGGAEIALPASVVRSSQIEIVGSGLGSVPRDVLVHSIGRALEAHRALGLGDTAVHAVPLVSVAETWSAPVRERVVFTIP